jgi:hypothetical protein
MLLGKTFHVFKGEKFSGLGTPLQVIQIINNAEHVRIANGDDPLLSEGCHMVLILLSAGQIHPIKMRLISFADAGPKRTTPDGIKTIGRC